MTKESSRPIQILIHKKSRKLELQYEDANSSLLGFEYLRIKSPSAEVRGHNPGEEQFPPGKKNVGITKINRVGNYAIQIIFDDDHDSGIYSWEYLAYLIAQKEILWSEYLNQLSEKGLSREPDEQVLRLET